jgi:hypothetical protein
LVGIAREWAQHAVVDCAGKKIDLNNACVWLYAGSFGGVRDMVSGRQKEFNVFIGSYIHERRRAHKEPFSLAGTAHRVQRKKDAELLEEKELMDADEAVARKGFFERVFDALFGHEVVVEEDEPEDELPLEGVAKKEQSPAKLAHAIFSGRRNIPVEQPEQEPEGVVHKVMLYKPKAEEDTREILRMMEALLRRVSWYEREQFMHSSDYLKYDSIKGRYR